MRPDQILKQFLSAVDSPDKPLVLGLSGGVDSMCLFYSLLSLQRKFHAVHINHRWRKESDREAAILQGIAQKHQISFHEFLLSPENISGNLENSCRKQRHQIFAEVANKIGAEACLLGHHSDDQAETVLKRFFEGVPLNRLSSIKQCTEINGLKIWRPFLNLPKRTLVEWMEEKGFSWEEDRTNQDIRYLRSRMRVQLIPYLSKLFGKNIQSSLCRIGQEANELEEFIDIILDPYISQKIEGPFGVYYDFADHAPKHLFVWKSLVRKILADRFLHASASWIEQAVRILSTKQANCKLSLENSPIFIDRGRIFFFANNPGDWVVVDQNVEVEKSSNWKDSWKGEVISLLPKGEGEFVAPKPEAIYGSKNTLRKWWSKHKIPHFFWRNVPVFMAKGVVVQEFLTGMKPKGIENKNYLKGIKLKYLQQD